MGALSFTSQSAHVQYIIKSMFLLLLLIFEMFLNSIIDSLDNTEDLILSVVLQMCIRAATIFVMFLLMSNTFVFQHGLLDIIRDKFKIFFIATPISFIFLLIIRIFKIVHVTGKIYSAETWNNDTFVTFFFLYNLSSIIYFASCLQAAFELGDPILYKPAYWLSAAT